MAYDIVISAWETWCGTKTDPEYKHVVVENEDEAHIIGREFALSLLEPHMNDIKHCAEYLVDHEYFYNYEDALHETMLQVAHYELWGIWRQVEE